ncbi:MAG TPA: hypothetical protein DG753_00235 [Clostridium sp.]|nr:hypothetical protein [Clostridium sp.]
MSRLGIKYDGCKTTVDDLKKISNFKYNDLISDLESVLRTAEGLTYKPDTSGVSNSISKAEEHKQKIMNFANGLDSYAEKLYNFDNSFYNNFVKLDGTNSENYKSNISDINISDDEIESLALNDATSLEALLFKINKIVNYDLSLGNDSTIGNIKNELRDFILSDENPKALKYLLRGNSFKVIRTDEGVFIKLKKGDIDPSDLQKCAKYLHDELNALSDRQLANILSGEDTKNIRKLQRFVERAFSKEGAKIYDASRNKLSKYAKWLSRGEFDDLNGFIKDSKLSFWKYTLKNAKEAAKDDLLGEAKYIKDNLGKSVKSFKSGNLLDDVKNAKVSKLEFLGKAVGVVDKVNTLWNNANDDLKDENGNWDFTDAKKDKKFVVDTAVDLGTSAGAAAAGAAIGSVVPGIGTVVGAAAGAAISVGINHKFIGEPPKSIVDETKELANKAVDKIGDTIGKIFW